MSDRPILDGICRLPTEFIENGWLYPGDLFADVEQLYEAIDSCKRIAEIETARRREETTKFQQRIANIRKGSKQHRQRQLAEALDRIKFLEAQLQTVETNQ